MRRALFKLGFFFIFFRGITGSTSSKLCHECGNSLLRVSWVGEQRRRGPSERGRERSEDAERSWRSINEILAGQSHRDAVLAVLHHCFQAWSAGLKAPQSGTISPFKTSFSGLIYSRKKKMGSGRFRVKTPGIAALLSRSLLCIAVLLLTFSQPDCEAFNLDVENPAVYSGPAGSYFGYAVDFYLADSSRWVSLTHQQCHFPKQFNRSNRKRGFSATGSSTKSGTFAQSFIWIHHDTQM